MLNRSASGLRKFHAISTPRMRCSAIRKKGVITTATTVLPGEINFQALEDRYSRQRLIPYWDQGKLAKARILVAGAGALGNEVLKNLALIGIGKIIVIDFEQIELPNLARSVLFQEQDIGRSKAATAARALQKLNSEVQVTAIEGDLESDLGLGCIRECDLILGCLDSIYARWCLNRACWRAGRPWINAGINATVGEVCLHAPGQGACYECGMTQQMWRQIHERRSCMLMPKKLPANTVPGTAVIAALTAALQVQEALAWLHRDGPYGEKLLRPGEMLMLSLQPYSLSSFAMSEKQDCLAHETYAPSIFVDAHPCEITVADLLKKIPGAVSVQMDYDILESWHCSTCGEEPVGGRLSRDTGNQAVCRNCGSQRAPQLLHEIESSHWLSECSLSSLGVPARAILRITTHADQEFVELLGR